tara:strand:+ start:698 stop:979 length:282 start_codon:yes stop_codon:yes gene_type:complete
VPNHSATEGDLVIDIGANLGDFSIAASKIFPSSLVIAIEPNPITYFFLLWNLHLNGVRPKTTFSLEATPGQSSTGVMALHAAVKHPVENVGSR